MHIHILHVHTRYHKGQLSTKLWNKATFMIAKYLTVIIFTHFSIFYLQQLATIYMVDKNTNNSEVKCLTVMFS
jgi:hypothetical protein